MAHINTYCIFSVQHIYCLYEQVHIVEGTSMPKMIDNLKVKIITEAKRQVFENGYANMTLRSVAKSCQIAVGTIYNYYPSKEVLVATFILEDWMPIASDLQSKCSSCDDVITACHHIYDGLLRLGEEYQVLFSEDAAIKTASTVYPQQHRKLRKQIAEMLKAIYRRHKAPVSDFLPEFLAESLLAWSSEKRDFSDLEIIFSSLIKRGEK